MEIGNKKCEQLLGHIANVNNKVSRLDLDKRKDAFAAGIEKQRKITKLEMNVCGPDVPAEMDGGLKKKDLVRKYDRHIEAEMKKRQIKYPKGKDGKSKLFKELTMKEKRDLLVLDEIRILAEQGKAREGIEPRNVKYIVPQSEEMKELVATINNS